MYESNVDEEDDDNEDEEHDDDDGEEHDDEDDGKTYPLPCFSEASAFIIASKAPGWTLGADLFILIKALS